ncbi:hypothetical protein [Sporosarcina highlanderae]|uniref:DUF3221 domain-containing protein n=1 Tax=Sporosarcina highlanderae TaxID=3035916 RepID=A0ABT8JPX5_9BACL|nr:hypothetical protein [Sporosarcina highlanderae]MDN4607206.1 hypothetical protein [Sporosarcina highlanderae]
MNHKVFRYLIILASLFFISACGGNNISMEDSSQNENKKNSIEQLENPLLGYYAGIIYDDKITLDITEYREKEAEEQGAELLSVHALLHVKITEDLKITDTEGNILSLESLDIGDKVYIDVQKLENKEITIETNLLIVEK